MSLVIPLIVLFNLIISIFFILKKSNNAVVSILIFMWGSIVIAKSFSFTNDSEFVKPSIDLLTHNMSKFGYDDGELNEYEFGEFSDWLDKHDFDIICLQEFVEFRSDPIALPGYNKLFSGKYLEDGNRFGLAIFSKRPLIDHGSVEFGINSFNRLLWSDIVINLDTIRIINVHLKSYIFSDVNYLDAFNQMREGVVGRSWQAKIALDFIKDSPYPVILGGDLNEPPYTYVYRELNSILKDTFEDSGAGYEYSFTFFGVPLRIDYVFIDPIFSSSSYKVIHDVGWSDHSPVSIQIGVPNRF